MTDARFDIKPYLRDEIILHTQTATYWPLRPVLIHLLIHTVGISLGLDIPIHLPTYREIDTQPAPMPKGILQIQGNADVMERLMTFDLLTQHQREEVWVQFGIDHTRTDGKPVGKRITESESERQWEVVVLTFLIASQIDFAIRSTCHGELLQIRRTHQHSVSALIAVRATWGVEGHWQTARGVGSRREEGGEWRENSFILIYCRSILAPHLILLRLRRAFLFL